jgi:hypothetical protein
MEHNQIDRASFEKVLSICYAELSEIILRPEPGICDEAASERTLGQQRRFLAPHRMRMKPDLLLARTAIEESGQGAKVPLHDCAPTNSDVRGNGKMRD